MNATTVNRRTAARSSTILISEWWFVGAVTAIVLVLSSIPYLYAFLSAPPDKVFMGIMLDVPDHGQYFSWMRELSTSNLAPNKLTPEPNRAIFFNLLWWGMGRAGRLLGLGIPVMYQILRGVASVLFLALAYGLCAWFLKDRLQRRVAFLVIAFTSGFGWILILLKYTFTHGELLFPLDVYVAEGNTFLGILGYPHFIAAALYTGVFFLVLKGEKLNQIRYAIFAGLLAFFFGWQHAYDLVLVYGILGLYTLLKIIRDWRPEHRLPLYLFISLPVIGLISWWPALYSLILTNLDPVWKEVLAQFANAGVYSPDPLHLIILLGPAFLLAIYTVIRNNPLKLGRFNDNQLFLLAWFVGNFALIYIPTDFQIHMLNGWQIPIAILAVQGLFQYLLPWFQEHTPRWLPQIRSRLRRPNQAGVFLSAILILAVIPTNLYLLTWRFTELSRHDYPYYLYKDEVDAMHWLDQRPGGDDVILSSLNIGQYLPAMTGKYAFLAHWAQTLNFYDKERLVSEFFSTRTSEDQRKSILDGYSVDYVFYGPSEHRLGDFSPQDSPLLKLVYSNARVQVFAVRN